MKNITKYLLTFLILLPIIIGISFTATAQIAINPDGSSPDASAMLDVVSSDKGVLVPRMDSTSRKSISNPATGLLVFDNTTNSFWFYTTEWTELLTETNTLTDADNDTKVEVEANTDEDAIHLTSNNVETIYINENKMEVSSDFYVGFQGYASSSSVSVENPITNNSYAVVSSSNTAWQSFTASDNGLIDNIVILLGAQPASSYDFSLYEGEGMSGQLLGNVTLSSPNASGYNTLDFSGQNIVLEKDKVYSLGSSSRNNLGFKDDNPYAGGELSYGEGDYDLIFSLNVFKAEYGLSVVDGVSNLADDITTNQSDITTLQNDLAQAAPIGTIQMWPTATAPDGWLICIGQEINESDYPELYQVLGGKNGKANLPNFEGRFPLGAGLSTANGATTHDLTDAEGEETVTLDIDHIPAHTHNVTYSDRSKDGNGNNVSDLGGSGETETTSSTGGGKPHNNMPPFYTINFIIKAE